MKNKAVFTMALVFVCSAFLNHTSFAKEAVNFDITTPLKLWLMNNEAKAMTELGRDDFLIKMNSTPFSTLPKMSSTYSKSEEELWATHRNIYGFLDEVQKIYDLSKRFGNGKFAVTIKQARPEIWGYSAIGANAFAMPKTVSNETRRANLKALFVCMSLDTNRDKDLSGRLKAAIKSLKDEEFRLTQKYISTFKALYPSERSVVTLNLFLEQAVKKQFGLGLKEIINSVESLRLTEESFRSDEEYDPLAELESLSESKTEKETKSVSEMESPDPKSKSLYDIW